mmetsp:Transcript_7805/g.19350  ORF Transcript_7805/g.19350 Transcript_7805/m.19350 type:complete len:248 (+) Transcript_7805:127-870(+)
MEMRAPRDDADPLCEGRPRSETRFPGCADASGSASREAFRRTPRSNPAVARTIAPGSGSAGGAAAAPRRRRLGRSRRHGPDAAQQLVVQRRHDQLAAEPLPLRLRDHRLPPPEEPDRHPELPILQGLRAVHQEGLELLEGEDQHDLLAQVLGRVVLAVVHVVFDATDVVDVLQVVVSYAGLGFQGGRPLLLLLVRRPARRRRLRRREIVVGEGHARDQPVGFVDQEGDLDGPLQRLQHRRQDSGTDQ